MWSYKSYLTNGRNFFPNFNYFILFLCRFGEFSHAWLQMTVILPVESNCWYNWTCCQKKIAHEFIRLGSIFLQITWTPLPSETRRKSFACHYFSRFIRNGCFDLLLLPESKSTLFFVISPPHSISKLPHWLWRLFTTRQKVSVPDFFDAAYRGI